MSTSADRTVSARMKRYRDRKRRGDVILKGFRLTHREIAQMAKCGYSVNDGYPTLVAAAEAMLSDYLAVLEAARSAGVL